jgi:O-antigen/teichoic acid export membrane protein
MLLIILVALISAGIFAWSYRKKDGKAPDSKRSLKIVYLTYGLLLVACCCVALDAVGWFVWLALTYLVTGAPVIMAVLFFQYYRKRKLSRNDKLVTIAASLYYVILFAIAILFFQMLRGQYS